MQAVLITRPGGPEVLERTSVPDPVAGPEDVLVRVRATALNRADLLQRRGHYPAPPGAPADIPGLEFAGEVLSRGERVRSLEPGDRVMGLLGGGGYADRVALHERLCLRVPPALDWTQAAAVPEAFLTAYDALYREGGLAAGETVLIHAAGSGVGTAAAQLADVGGAFAVGLSRSADKRRRLDALGLHRVLDATAPDLAEQILLATGGHGVDVVLDAVGAATWALNAEVLRERGRWVLLGLLGGAHTEIDLAAVLRKRLRLTGTVLRTRPLEERATLVQEFGRRILPLFASGRLAPIVDRTMNLGQAAEAHALMERNANFGKIVLRVDDGAGR